MRLLYNTSQMSQYQPLLQDEEIEVKEKPAPTAKCGISFHPDLFVSGKLLKILAIVFIINLALLSVNVYYSFRMAQLLPHNAKADIRSLPRPNPYMGSPQGPSPSCEFGLW